MKKMKKSIIPVVLSVAVLWGAGSTSLAEILPAQGAGQIGWQAVVLCESLTLYQEPDTDSETVKMLQYGDKIIVKVGTMTHPMEEVHYIEWIAIETEQGTQRKYLKPGDEPKATFSLTEDDTLVAIYEHCNLHGLWKAE